MLADQAYDSMAAREIIELHEFLEDWFTGRCANDDTVWSGGLLQRFTDDFRILMPGGVRLTGSGLWDPLRAEHGRNPDFKINIRKIEQDAALRDGVTVWTYEEWQLNALNASPPDNGRAASVVFVADESTPTGLKWAHVHETWLPQAVIGAEPFDW